MSRRLMALVIGNATYAKKSKLTNPVNDAEDIGAKLEACGFSVVKVTDCSIAQMDDALKRFQRGLQDIEVGLFFFAGHGMQIEGENYLTAVDTDFFDESTAKYLSLPLNRVIEVMEKAPTSTNIIILDACRDNPFERAWNRSAASRGLASVYAPKGTLIAFATSPGQVAKDGKGRNGAYTSALLQHIDTPDCSIENMFKRVRNTLSAATNQGQISWEHTSLSGEFYFNLSLGVRINIYSETALSDGLFVLDEAKASHRVIKGLKSCTWPDQNPAVDDLTPALANKASISSLFVVGRNIYQAACGNARRASNYILDFINKTNGMTAEKRKALLDGILFEVFYDSSAKLRDEFKLGKFQDVFALQQYKEVASSFDFIAECLLPDVRRFYVIPGKRHQVVVDVVTEPDTKLENAHILKSLHCDGVDILRLDDDDYEVEPGETVLREKLSISNFEKRLSEQMVVPPHLLKINYQSFNRADKGRILFPYGFSARKPL